MSPPIFVVETNVVVAGLITGSIDSPVASVLDVMLSGSLPCLMSLALLAEYRSVLLRPKVSNLHGLTEAEIDGLLVDLTASTQGAFLSPAIVGRLKIRQRKVR